MPFVSGLRVWLKNVLRDGRLEPSNNRAERSIRPFTVGRKNWLFSNTPKGATASAMFCSIVETAKENGLKPYEYFKYLLESVPLEVENLTFGYPGQPRLHRNLSFALKCNERFLVVGENGVGKSTLLKLLVGILTPESGEIRFNPKTDAAYYAQELEMLDAEKRILDSVETPGFAEWQLRTVLGNFLFYGDDVFKRVATLSPGEKARVALCKVLLQKANLLILDEPTNHLDPETQEVIGGNFHAFPGTIMVVSHNPAFVEQIGISRMLILPSGRIENYSRELLDYYYELNTADEDR